MIRALHRGLLLALGIAAAWLAAPAAEAQDRPPWWDANWPYRLLVTIRARQDFPNSPAAAVWVHLREGADPDGSDIRVVGPDGIPIPFGILHSGPEGRHLLAFEARQKQGFYAVYHGNRRAGPTHHVLPRRGLVYETKPIPEDADASSWQAARDDIERAGRSFGADLWNRVFDAYNPFGPQSDYIGIYRGYIRCPRDGRYEFATMSDHSSFVLIDGRPVTQWTGSHGIGAGRRGEQSGAVELGRGMHELLYVHFAFGGPARGALAWKPPGADRFEIVPHPAFPGLLEAEVYECEQWGQPLCADFTAEPERYLEAGDARMTAVRFTSRSSTAAGSLVARYEWDFGDGQTAGDSQPLHVFMAPGEYSVALTITSTAGGRATCRKTLPVGPIWTDLNFTQQKMDQFWDWTRGHDLAALPTPALRGAWEFFKSIEREDEAFRAALALDERRDELTPAQVFEVAMAVARRYQRDEERLDDAERYLKLALESVPDADRARRFEARFELCDHYFYYRADPERGRREYERLRADFPQADPSRRRLALIRVGDTWRNEGELDEALRSYRQAEADPAFAPDKPKALVAGTIVHEVESYLRRGEGDEALKRLEELLWYYPTMRLEGQPALLRARANLVRRDFAEAKKQADLYIGFGKDPNFLPAVHVAAADACIELGLTDEAREHFRAVLDDFPESAAVTDAQNGLRRLGG